jgi:hypothetical protein
VRVTLKLPAGVAAGVQPGVAVEVGVGLTLGVADGGGGVPVTGVTVTTVASQPSKKVAVTLAPGAR